MYYIVVSFERKYCSFRENFEQRRYSYSAFHMSKNVTGGMLSN
jgi:hypothetical protein